MGEETGAAGSGAKASRHPHRRDAYATDAGRPPAWQPTFLLITCEHGGHDIPEAHAHLFTGAEETLRSHRGWDAGALTLAQDLAADLTAPLIFSTTCRLLVELNRSEGHPELFSEFTRELPAADREELLARYYHPYRDSVRRTIDHAIAAGERVLHLSVHSFTPRLGDQVRTVEAGVLFDPARPAEAAVADWWLPRLRARGLEARPNEPYKGTDDGLTTALRIELAPGAYAGVELEIRNDLLTGPDARHIADGVAGDVRALLVAR